MAYIRELAGVPTSKKGPCLNHLFFSLMTVYFFTRPLLGNGVRQYFFLAKTQLLMYMGSKLHKDMLCVWASQGLGQLKNSGFQEYKGMSLEKVT
jgi:hypothetical protein